MILIADNNDVVVHQLEDGTPIDVQSDRIIVGSGNELFHIGDLNSGNSKVHEGVNDTPSDFRPLLYRYSGGKWTRNPNYPIPQVITMRQLQLALHGKGLLEQVEAAVAAADKVTQIEWGTGSTVEYHSKTLRAMQGKLNISDVDFNDLFIAGEIL